MTISSSAAPKAGPFIGNGVTTSFPFTFKVFDKSEVKVTLAVLATGAESVLVLDTNYTVTLNPDQNTNPGGSVTYNPSGTPMAATHSLTITSNVLEMQGTDITNGGGFYPQVIEDALDRAVILVKQLREVISRSLSIPVSSTASTVLPAPTASTFIGWNATGTALINYAGVTATPVSAFMATVLDDTTAGAALTTLGVSAFAQTLLDDVDAAAARATLGAAASGINTDITGFGSSIAFTGDITPAQITASQNDYNPTGLSTASVVRLSTDAARNLTGLAGGSDGRVVALVNIGAFPLVLNNEDAASTAANRFAFGTTYVLGPNRVIVLIYDSTSARWRILCIQRQTAAGQCRLTKSGANLLLSQMNGALLSFPDGSDAFVPSAGVTLAATSLAVDTNFYIYATKSAGVVNALAASATAPAQDANTGIYYKTGDTTQVLIGLARTITGPAWVDTAAQRFVRSWFNDPGISARNSLASDTTTTSASLVELNSGKRAEFLLWAGEPFLIAQSAFAKNNTNGTDSTTATGIDGTAAASNMITKFSTATATIDGKNDAGISAAADPVAEGYHYATLLAAVTGGTGTWFAGSGISVFTGGRK